MAFYQEEEFFAYGYGSKNQIIAASRLKNGVFLLIRENGTALGSDNRMYRPVCISAEGEYMNTGIWKVVDNPETGSTEE